MKEPRQAAGTWSARRREHDKLTPAVVVRDVRIQAAKDKKGAYEVVIRGVGLRPWAVPPDVRVGGVRLVEMEFARDGTAVRGFAPTPPAGPDVEVDLGYARTVWKPA